LQQRVSNPVCVKNVTAIETSKIVKLLRPYVPVGTKRTRRRRRRRRNKQYHAWNMARGSSGFLSTSFPALMTADQDFNNALSYLDKYNAMTHGNKGLVHTMRSPSHSGCGDGN
jgi:hypothetical protein